MKTALSQNYWCHVTLTLYKPDTFLRRTVGTGLDGVLLGESFCIPSGVTASYTLVIRWGQLT